MTSELNSLKRSTAAHLAAYARLSEQDAKTLVDALCDAAQAEMLTMISGAEPYPTSMSDLRALRLRYICQAAGRMLTPREVGILFRTTDSSAQTLLTKMQRLYPAAVDDYLDALVVSTGHFELIGDKKGATRVLFEFPQLGAWERALAKLEWAGATDIKASRTALTIETPLKLTNGKSAIEALGLPAEAKRG